MSASLRSGSAAVIAVVFVLCCAAAALAHFNLNMNVRIIHVEHLSDGLRLYLRTPMPYLVADKIGQLGKDGLPEPAPIQPIEWKRESWFTMWILLISTAIQKVSDHLLEKAIAFLLVTGD